MELTIWSVAPMSRIQETDVPVKFLYVDWGVGSKA